jgi:flagellar hook-associated protein 1 FlgK
MLDTAAHNVANANTPGYSRQRVAGRVAAVHVPGVQPQRPAGPDRLGRHGRRDHARPGQLPRSAGPGPDGLKGEWDTRQQELSKVESIFPEPSDSGLGSVISKYWSAWQDVASDPTSTAARTALTEQASSLAMEMNRDSTQLGHGRDRHRHQVAQVTTSTTSPRRSPASTARSSESRSPATTPTTSWTSASSSWSS